MTPDAERTAESRPPIAWSRADELAYEAARRRLGNSWGAWLRERLALAERLAAPGPTRTGPGAMDPPDGPVTPPPSRYRPHSPTCGTNGRADRPRIDPEVKRAARNAAQNASRAAKRSADLYTCQDCHGPTGRRAGALRCYRCSRSHKCVARNANRAARKALEAGK